MSADEPSSRGAALVLIALMLGSGGAVLLIAVTPVDEGGSSEDENRPVKGASEAVPGHVKALVAPWSGHWRSIPVGHLAGST